MGAQYSLGHRFGEVTVENFRLELANIIDIDFDMNGTNGLEYTSDEALEKGYTSDLEYYLETAVSLHGKTKKAIVHALQLAFSDDDYVDYQYVILEKEDGFIVSVAYMYRA